LVGCTGRPTWTYSDGDLSICVHDVYRVTTCRPGRGHIVPVARLQLVQAAVKQPTTRPVGRPRRRRMAVELQSNISRIVVVNTVSLSLHAFEMNDIDYGRPQGLEKSPSQLVLSLPHLLPCPAHLTLPPSLLPLPFHFPFPSQLFFPLPPFPDPSLPHFLPFPVPSLSLSPSMSLTFP